MYSAVKDSGERTTFSTGSVRDKKAGKGRYDLLPVYAIKRLAQHYENGAVKYGEENWRKGQPLRGYLDSGIRHAMNYLEGQRDEDHLAAALWNIAAVIETEEMIRRGLLPISLNDLPDWTERDVEQVDERAAMSEGPYEFETEAEEAAWSSGDFDPSLPLGGQVTDPAIWAKPANLTSGAVEGINPEFVYKPMLDPSLLPVDLDLCGTLDGITSLPVLDKTPLPYLATYAGHWNNALGFRDHWRISDGGGVLYGSGDSWGESVMPIWVVQELIEVGQWKRCDTEGRVL